MKRFRFMPKLAAAIVSAAMIFSGAVPAFADDTTTTTHPNGGNLTLDSQIVKFNTKLTLNVTKSSDAVNITVPAKTISYTIKNGDADSTNGILAGVNDDKLSVSSSVFNSKSVIKNDETTPYVIATSSIDFSKAGFTAAGIYRYKIISQTNFDPAMEGDFNTTQYIDVVVANTDGKGYAVKDAAMINNAKTSKSDKFQFTYKATYLKFTKNIEGNQADVTKRFIFGMTLSDLTQPVTLTYNNVTSTNSTVLPTTLTPTSGTVSQNFSLTRGSSVTVDNIPYGYSFDINENPDGYTPTVKSNDINDSELANDHLTKSNINSKIEFTVTNTKGGTVPTGVIFAVAPFAIGAVAIAAFVILKVRKAAKQ